jgi:GDPmannose 4,6-dehydratase
MTTGSSRRVALIAGITGQDGAYLARFLLGKGYVVHGTSRDAALARLDGLIALGICDKIKLHSMSPADFQSVAQVIEGVAPDEIYNLSGQSSVSLSFTQPAETLAGIALGTLNMLETLRRLGGRVRYYNAGSSECFGDTGTRAANEQTAFRPKSPYGVAKAAAISLVANYRESYGLFACSGLLFNHESPLRLSRFVTRRSPLRPPGSVPAAARGSRSATCRSAATGAGLPIMSKPCGGCCSATSPTISSLLRVSPIRLKSS